MRSVCRSESPSPSIRPTGTSSPSTPVTSRSKVDRRETEHEEGRCAGWIGSWLNWLRRAGKPWEAGTRTGQLCALILAISLGLALVLWVTHG